MSGFRRAIIMYNPRAGSVTRSTVVQQLAAALTERSLEVSLETNPQQVQERLMAAPPGAEEELVVVAAGGDGTVGLAASLMPRPFPLAVLPLGTENLLAKYLGLTSDTQALAERIASGQVRTWDTIRVADRIGLLMVSCGMDAEVVRRLHERRTGHIHHLSYAAPIWQAWWDYAHPSIQIQLGLDADPDQWESAGEGHWVFVFNAPVYALGLPLAPQADPTDALLDLLILRDAGAWQATRYALALLRGRLDREQGVERMRARRVRLSASGGVPFQVDGDPGGVLPISLEVLPQQVRLVV